MTTYSVITSAQIDAESPIDTTLAAQWANNVLAIQEGDASASGVRIAAAALSSEQSPLILLSEQDASSDATIDMTNLLDSTYDEYIVYLNSVVPLTDGADLYMRVGTGATPTWQTSYSGSGQYGSVGINTDYNPGGSQINLSASINMDTGDTKNGWSGVIHLPNSQGVSLKTINFKGMFADNTGSHTPYMVDGSACYNAATVLTSLRWYFSSGSIQQGKFSLYGIRKV